MGVADQIEALVCRHDGLTDITLSEHIFGAPDYHQFVALACDHLVEAGRIARQRSDVASIGYIYART